MLVHGQLSKSISIVANVDLRESVSINETLSEGSLPDDVQVRKERMWPLAQAVTIFLGSRTFWVATLGWFLIQGVFFALTSLYTSKFTVPPDELFHTNFIQYYADHSWSPLLDSQEGFGGDWRDITRPPQYLYHYALSWPVRFLNLLGVDNVVVPLRLLNVGLAAANLVVLAKTLLVCRLPKHVVYPAVFIFSNLMMYTLLAGAINYDNAANLCASLLFYYLCKQYFSPNRRNLLFLLLLSVIAPIIKFTLLPLAVMIWLPILLLFRRFEVLDTLQHLWRGLLARNKKFLLYAVVFLVGFGLFAERYGGNMVAHGSMRPACDAIHSEEVCMQSALYRRSLGFNEVAANERMHKAIFTSRWLVLNHTRTVGTLSHKNVATFTKIEKITFWLFIASLLIMARNIRLREIAKRNIVSLLALISVAYLALAAYGNYQIYVTSGLFGLALQGRYVFPVYFFLMAIPLYYVARYLGKNMYPVAVIALLGLYFLSGMPAHIARADLGNYQANYRDQVETVRNVLHSVTP